VIYWDTSCMLRGPGPGCFALSRCLAPCHGNVDRCAGGRDNGQSHALRGLDPGCAAGVNPPSRMGERGDLGRTMKGELG
jgi:hypothetical protein